MKLSVLAEYELDRWAKANPDPDHVAVANAVLRLVRALESSGVDAGDYPDALRLFARLVEPAPLTPLTAEDGWIEERGHRVFIRLYNKRWSRFMREVDGRYIAYFEFINGIIFVKYRDERWPTCCGHDVMYIVAITRDEVSEEDRQELERLGFAWSDSDECWLSYRFGSA